MGDQGKWFKLWHSALDDPDLEELSLEDFGRWCRFGLYLKVHGNSGTLPLRPPASALQRLFRVDSFDAVVAVLARFPGTVTDVTNATVTWRNWLKYQGDNSIDRVRRFRGRVTAQEEKRREEREGGGIPPPPPSVGRREKTAPPTGAADAPRPEKTNPLTKRTGLLGDLARIWQHELGPHDPAWPREAILNFQKRLRSMRSTSPNEPPDCAVRDAFRDYCRDPNDHPSHEGKPLSTYTKRLDAYLQRFKWETHATCGPGCHEES